jgi:hypothetical protein
MRLWRGSIEERSGVNKRSNYHSSDPHSTEPVLCDLCEAHASSVHLLPDGTAPTKVVLACDRHDPGGEWWMLTDKTDLDRLWDNDAVLERLRPGITARLPFTADRTTEDDPHAPDDAPEYDISQMGFALVCIGAIGMAVAAFLPYAETTGFQRIAENTLIQQQGGWALLIFAVGAFASAYRKYSLGRPGWAPSVWGLLALGIAIWIGTDKSLRTLYPVGSNGEANTSLPGTVAGVGIGVYLAGAAGAITDSRRRLLPVHRPSSSSSVLHGATRSNAWPSNRPHSGSASSRQF